jgi:pyruvate/2-oxoglutarate dehydrogenase complex dihydrolipoamide dehydrogenase (E3) component
VAHEIESEEIFHALGRSPNFASLGLEHAGVQVAKGKLEVQPTQQTNVPHIYAAGDICGPYEIVHLAIQQAEVAVRNMLRGHRQSAEALEEMDYRLKLFVLFTRPEVAQVGLTEAEARATGEEIGVATYPFNDHGKSLVMGETEGFVKLLTRASTGEILGGSVIGPEAASLIHEIAVAMHYRGTAQDLARIPHYHPTLSEIWTYPAEDLAV